MLIRFEYRIVLLIAFITVINYFDRSAISYAIIPLEQSLGLNDYQFGIAAAGFGVGYLVMAFFGGLLVDRYGSYRTWILGTVVWSIATIATGLVKDFYSLVMFRVLLGLGEGVHFPALLKTISDWLHPSTRARAISFSLLGVPLASVIGSTFMTFLIVQFGWREMFFILGAFGFIWAFFWFFAFRNKVNPHLATSAAPNHPISWRSFLLQKSFLANCFAFFSLGYVIFFALIWLPGYLEKAHGITIEKTGVMVTIPWLAGSFLIILGGHLSDFLWKHTHSIRKARTYLIALGLLIAGLCFYGISQVHAIGPTLLLLSLGLGFAFLTNSPIYALNADLFPRRVGTAQGILGVFFALSGIVSPAITGWLVESSGNFQSAFVAVAGISVLAAIAVLIFQRDGK